MVDVFISYSRTNQDMVRRLADAVKRLGYDVWWDDELPPHLSYGDVITEKIGAAKAAIVVWSQGSAGSEWVRAEADLARNQKKLIQTSIDDCMPPMPFNQIQFASIGDWDGVSDHSGWRKVQASLTALCGPPPRGAEAGGGVPSQPTTPPPVAPPPPPGVTAPPRPLPPAGTSRSNVVIAAAIAASLAVILLVVGLTLFKNRGPAPAVAANGMQVARPGNETAGTQTGIVAAGNGQAGEAGNEAGTEAAADPDEVLPGSGQRALTEAEVQSLTAEQLRLARNEIYARHGRIFQDPRLTAHFSRYSWYAPTSTEVSLTPIEQANVNLLTQAEGW
jgi:YARHG domain/TIR domain